MSLLDLLKIVDTAVTALVLGAWVYSLRQRAKQLRSSLQRWQNWYREDMTQAVESLEDQQQTQDRQQEQMESLIEQLAD